MKERCPPDGPLDPPGLRWIPAFAGMTEVGAIDREPSGRICRNLRRTRALLPYSSMSPRAQLDTRCNRPGSVPVARDRS
jgi:hypothetical protein